MNVVPGTMKKINKITKYSTLSLYNCWTLLGVHVEENNDQNKKERKEGRIHMYICTTFFLFFFFAEKNNNKLTK